VKTTRHQKGRDTECRENVPTHPSPIIAPDYAHYDGNEKLHCPGAKCSAVLVVYGEELVSPYSASVQ